jgi:hypothetical protein
MTYRLLSVLMAIACISMVFIGLAGYHGWRSPCDLTKMIYNHYYFVPYVVLSGVFLVYALLGFNAKLRVWLSSICFGTSLFGYFFIPVSGAGHDFGHVLYGGCFESVRMDSLIQNINLCLMGYAIFLVILGIREYRTKKIS